MKEFLSNILNVIKVMIWPILLGIGQFLIAWILTYAYLSIHQITDSSSLEVQLGLAQFVANYTWIVFFWNILLILFFGYFYCSKKKRLRFTVPFKPGLLAFLLGISLALVSSVALNFFFPVTISNDVHYHLWMQILTIGITGPIVEELVFRGIMLDKLKKSFSSFWPYLLVTVIFAFCHQGIHQMIYACLMGSLFMWIYYKTDRLEFAIFAHIGANVVTLCLESLIFPNKVFLFGIFFVSTILLGISFYLFYRTINKK